MNTASFLISLIMFSSLPLRAELAELNRDLFSNKELETIRALTPVLGNSFISREKLGDVTVDDLASALKESWYQEFDRFARTKKYLSMISSNESKPEKIDQLIRKKNEELSWRAESIDHLKATPGNLKEMLSLATARYEDAKKQWNSLISEAVRKLVSTDEAKFIDDLENNMVNSKNRLSALSTLTELTNQKRRELARKRADVERATEVLLRWVQKTTNDSRLFNETKKQFEDYLIDSQKIHLSQSDKSGDWVFVRALESRYDDLSDTRASISKQIRELSRLSQNLENDRRRISGPNAEAAGHELSDN
jgi:predicted nucleic acid-binding OB-fold protein